MEFMNRGFKAPNTQTNQATAPAPSPGEHIPVKSGKSGGKLPAASLVKAGQLSFLVLLVILIALAFTVLIMFNGKSREAGLVNSSQYQAVFLNGGQVYFGKIGQLNNRYLSVGDVYYLRVNQQVQPDANAANNAQNDISLVKLGCELHGPEDRMVINREQIIFWENLKVDGQVAKAIEQYKTQFPNGQPCEEQQAGTTAPTGQSTSPAGIEESQTTNPPATTAPTNNNTGTTNNTNR